MTSFDVIWADIVVTFLLMDCRSNDVDTERYGNHKAAVGRTTSVVRGCRLFIHIYTDLHYGSDRIRNGQQKSGRSHKFSVSLSSASTCLFTDV